MMPASSIWIWTTNNNILRSFWAFCLRLWLHHLLWLFQHFGLSIYQVFCLSSIQWPLCDYPAYIHTHQFPLKTTHRHPHPPTHTLLVLFLYWFCSIREFWLIGIKTINKQETLCLCVIRESFCERKQGWRVHGKAEGVIWAEWSLEVRELTVK